MKTKRRAHEARRLWFPISENLFPLDRSGWFGGEVIGDTVNAVDFIDDPVGDAAQKFWRVREEVRRHAIG